MPLSSLELRQIIISLETYGSTPLEFFSSLLLDVELVELEAVQELQVNMSQLLDVMHKDPHTRSSTLEWAHAAVRVALADEVCKLAKKENGWHFNAAQATQTWLESFDVAAIASNIEALAPGLWKLLGVLLSADVSLSHRHKDEPQHQRRGATTAPGLGGASPAHAKTHNGAVGMAEVPSSLAVERNSGGAVADSDQRMDDEENAYWQEFNDEVVPGPENDDDEGYWQDDASDDNVFYASAELGDILMDPMAAESSTGPKGSEKQGILTMVCTAGVEVLIVACLTLLLDIEESHMCVNYDAEHEPTMQRNAKHNWYIPAFLQYSCGGHRFAFPRRYINLGHYNQ